MSTRLALSLTVFVALLAVLPGCGGGPGGEGGNPDAAAVIGTAPDDPNFGAASADLMKKMHGDSLATKKKGAEKAAEKPAEKK